MKKFNQTITALTGITTMLLTMLLGSPTQAAAGGTDILHFTVYKTLDGTGVETNADGIVVATQKAQGKADNQKLSIAITDLTANSTYELVAAIDADTNLVDIAPIVTDAHGNVIIEYTDLGHGHGGGKHSNPFPASLDSVSLIRAVDIYNTNAQLVLSADLSMPDKLDYLIKRDLSNGNVRASLMVQANTKRTHFRLLSTGLTPNTDYLLAFNGEVVQTNKANSKGRLDIHSLTDTPPYILDVRSVELWDTSSNAILQATMP